MYSFVQDREKIERERPQGFLIDATEGIPISSAFANTIVLEECWM